MNKAHFETIRKAADGFVQRIDSLAAAQQEESKTDYLFSDVVKRDRLKARREAAQFALRDGFETAKRTAVQEIDAMRQAFRRYMAAPADPAQLATLRALLESGVALTDGEIQAFAETGSYTVLRLLQPHSRGRVTVPDFEAFERDASEILSHFDTLAAYSGPNNELADFVEARPWGRSARVCGAILKGTIPEFPAKLESTAERWSMVKEEDA